MLIVTHMTLIQKHRRHKEFCTLINQNRFVLSMICATQLKAFKDQGEAMMRKINFLRAINCAPRTAVKL